MIAAHALDLDAVAVDVLRPFRVGDFVECAGTKGKVEKISVFYTELRSIDNKLVIAIYTSAGGGEIWQSDSK